MTVSDLEMSALSPDSRQVVMHEGVCVLVCNTGGTHYAPNGLYLWRVTYRDQLGYPLVRQGTVSLVR